jgi:hypothetical protein
MARKSVPVGQIGRIVINFQLVLNASELLTQKRHEIIKMEGETTGKISNRTKDREGKNSSVNGNSLKGHCSCLRGISLLPNFSEKKKAHTQREHVADKKVEHRRITRDLCESFLDFLLLTYRGES